MSLRASSSLVNLAVANIKPLTSLKEAKKKESAYLKNSDFFCVIFHDRAGFAPIC
jgi:hypothetical protein